jgi:hypothetical protein
MIEHQGGPVLFGVLGIAQQPGEQPVDDRLEFLGHHLGSFCCALAAGPDCSWRPRLPRWSG